MRLSNNNQAILYYYNKGYRVTKEGFMIRPDSSIVLGSIQVYTPNKSKGNLNYKYKVRVVTGKKNGKNIYCPVHRFVAYCKYGDKIFEEGIQVRHKNGDSLDNSWDNILIGTQSDNMMDIPEEIRKASSDKAWRAANPRTKEEREEIYNALISGESYKSIKNRLGVSLGTLSYMKNKSKEFKDYCNSKK